MKQAAAILSALVASGCVSSEAIKKMEKDTLPSGWTVRCVYNQHKDVNRCFAGKFGKTRYGAYTPPFQIVYVNNHGPFIKPGYHDFPGRQATVRVDNGEVFGAVKPHSVPAPSAVIEALKAGSKAYVTYHSWPRGEERMTVDIGGFAEAFALLQKKRLEPRVE